MGKKKAQETELVRIKKTIVRKVRKKVVNTNVGIGEFFGNAAEKDLKSEDGKG